MAAERAGWTTREAFRDRVEQLLGAGSISPPYHRGDRWFFTRREPGQQFPVLCTVDPDGTERVLLDPMALDPEGLTTLDSWQPSKEGDLLAYQVSEGGTEESVLRVMDVVPAPTSTGRSTAAATPPWRGSPGGRVVLLRAPAAPRGAARVRAAVPPPRVPAPRRHRPGAGRRDLRRPGMTITNYYGVEVSRDGRWLQVSASEGTAPRNDLWLADLSADPPESPAFRLVQVDVDAQTGIDVGRDGRFYVSTDLDAPRGRLAVTAPDRLRPRPVGGPAAAGPRGRPGRVRDARRAGAGPAAAAGHLDRARGRAEMTLHELPDGERCSCGRPARARDRRRTGRAARGRSESRGSSTPTTPPCRTSTPTTRAPGRWRCAPAPPATVRGPRGALPPGRLHLEGRHARAHVRAVPVRTSRTGRGPPCCTATAGSGSR